jgi:pyruvate formate lyase activating enzyme
MVTGTIFDIREFAVHDGPGIRTTVGETIRADDLAELLNKQAPIFKANEGGVTFSGGEPLMQPQFVAAVIDRLDGIHVLLDTSGYADRDDFCLVAERCDLIYFDLKLVDPSAHRQFAGQDNRPILDNLHLLADVGVPYVIRVPLVPGITDTDANLNAIAEVIQNLRGLLEVNLLAYNRAAGGKYRGLGMTFKPTWDETRAVNADVTRFTDVGLKATVLGLRNNEG